jgi:hypothetical protein
MSHGLDQQPAESVWITSITPFEARGFSRSPCDGGNEKKRHHPNDRRQQTHLAMQSGCHFRGSRTSP